MNFEKLEFNPYEVLNLEKDCTKNDIKKKYKKLILKFHPDKNKEVDNADLIFNIVNQSYNILIKNKDSYDNYLLNKTKSKNYLDLKENFKNEKNNTNNINKINNEYKKENEKEGSYEYKEMMLNKKHNFNPEILNKESSIPLNSDDLKDKINELIENRNNIKICQDLEHDNILKSKEKFNSNFENINHNKKNEELNKLSVYQGNNTNTEIYSELNMISELYQDSNVENEDYFSNLDEAFKIQNINMNDNNKKENLEDRIKQYENQTDLYMNQSTEKFKKQTYEEIVGISKKSIHGSIEDILPEDQ